MMFDGFGVRDQQKPSGHKIIREIRSQKSVVSPSRLKVRGSSTT